MNVIASIVRGVSLVVAALTAAATPATPAQLCTLQDPRLTESSGLAVSGATLYTHNDSGDGPRFFALDRGCRTVATYTLVGAGAVDWEDMARGAGALWLGDIGDNGSSRASVVVYRVPEPGSRPAVQRVAASAYRFRYEDGPHDAEALLVHPGTGQLFVVTKTYTGTAGVYAAPQHPSLHAVNVLTGVGTLRLRPSGTAGGPLGVVGQLAVTGGDVSADGERVVVRTYTDAYEWTVTGGDLAGAFAGSPSRTSLPATDQGEAISYDSDGRSWITTSEGAGAVVHRIARRPS